MAVIDGSAHLHTLPHLLVVSTQHELRAQERMDTALTGLCIELLTGVLNP